MWAGTTLVLTRHISAKSGIERVTPVACPPQGGGRFAIGAANGGSPTHPPELVLQPQGPPTVTVEVAPRRFTVLAGGTGWHRPPSRKGTTGA